MQLVNGINENPPKNSTHEYLVEKLAKYEWTFGYKSAMSEYEKICGEKWDCKPPKDDEYTDSDCYSEEDSEVFLPGQKRKRVSFGLAMKKLEQRNQPVYEISDSESSEEKIQIQSSGVSALEKILNTSYQITVGGEKYINVPVVKKLLLEHGFTKIE